FVLATNSQALPSATATIIDTANLKPSGYGVTGSAFGIAAPKNGSFAYLVDQTDNNGIYALNTNGKLDEVTSGDEAFQLNTPYALGAFMGGAPPVAPSDLTGTTNTYDRIDLTWSDNSDDELGFKIERRVKPEDGEENSYVEVAQVGQDVTSHTDGGLVGNNTYEYRIRAFNEAADSGYAILSGDGGGVTTEEGGFSWCFIGSLLE
ncbi:MAG: fibronectin type III domain-containing protein, partial [Desulfatitalea sp.]|nr:fibronectin type III domain-containing protein [Desulfatitalea sp.]